ncbi:MAG TPA: D-aminoacylase [Gemmatimonadales bacterium]|jgi:N-acyl-D-amino-acid deacylase|nr:D-aminoacylase [Gemmatimonadales bacterium]
MSGSSISRRDFVATTGAVVAAVASPALIRPARSDFDLLIRGGIVLDGLGGAGVAQDVAIAAGRIASLGKALSGRAAHEIDARGLAVAPGFIDMHSHVDGSLRADWRAESAIRQGITTVIAGQDGSSRATGAADDSFRDMFAALEALHPAVNVASMVGLGSVRDKVVGDDDRPATAAEIAAMTAMVRQALNDGACGASSGLEYTPGGFASREELIALCRPLAPRKLPYATHMRNEDDHVLEAIDEAIAVAEGARCPLEISHLKTQGQANWHKLDDAFARIAAANKRGMDVAFDRYPYLAYSTGLTNLFPIWSRDGGTDAFLGRLDDPATAATIKEATLAKVAGLGGWDHVEVTSVRNDADRAAEGKRLGSYAQSIAADPYDTAVALLRRSNGGVGMVGFAMSEENLERILAHPLATVCTDGSGFAIDGPTRRGSPHPRGIGTCPRVLGYYVRERKALTLPDAIAKMSSHVARRLHIRDRGRLARGLAADVVVFDPATVADVATYENPFQYPVGIKAVVVNGAVALEDGERQGTGQGKMLKAEG